MTTRNNDKYFKLLMYGIFAKQREPGIVPQILLSLFKGCRRCRRPRKGAAAAQGQIEGSSREYCAPLPTKCHEASQARLLTEIQQTSLSFATLCIGNLPCRVEGFRV